MRPLRPNLSATSNTGYKKSMGHGLKSLRNHLYSIDFTTVSHWDTIANQTLQGRKLIPRKETYNPVRPPVSSNPAGSFAIGLKVVG